MEGNNYTIKVTPKAFEDLDEIYGYIANDLYNEDAAGILMEKIETNIMRLKYYPFSCSYVSERLLKEKGYRKLIVDNYIVFHLVKEAENEVLIMRVLYAKQKYQDLI